LGDRRPRSGAGAAAGPAGRPAVFSESRCLGAISPVEAGGGRGGTYPGRGVGLKGDTVALLIVLLRNRSVDSSIGRWHDFHAGTSRFLWRVRQCPYRGPSVFHAERGTPKRDRQEAAGRTGEPAGPPGTRPFSAGGRGAQRVGRGIGSDMPPVRTRHIARIRPTRVEGGGAPGSAGGPARLRSTPRRIFADGHQPLTSRPQARRRTGPDPPHGPHTPVGRAARI